MKSKIKNLQNDVEALSVGALSVSKHLDTMKIKQKDLTEKQTKHHSTPLFINNAEKLYQSAILLVQEGASVDELISQCDLVREEAELISIVHSQDAQKTASYSL